MSKRKTDDIEQGGSTGTEQSLPLPDNSPVAVPSPAVSLYSALFAVQNEIEGITKDANNPFFKSKYADRTTVLNAIRPLFAKYGLLLIQAPVESGEGGAFSGGDMLGEEKDGELSKPVVALRLKTTIVHVATGEKHESTAVVPMPNPDPQGFASALTYTSRTSLVAILALPLLEDDDGNGASPHTTAKAKPQTRATPVPKQQAAPAAGATDTGSESQDAPTVTSPPPNIGKRKLWGS